MDATRVAVSSLWLLVSSSSCSRASCWDGSVLAVSSVGRVSVSWVDGGSVVVLAFRSSAVVSSSISVVGVVDVGCAGGAGVQG